MDPIGTPSAAEISEAIIVWTGWGDSNRPARDELRLVERFGEDRARDLLPTLRRLEDEFYESDARFTLPILLRWETRPPHDSAGFTPSSRRMQLNPSHGATATTTSSRPSARAVAAKSFRYGPQSRAAR